MEPMSPPVQYFSRPSARSGYRAYARRTRPLGVFVESWHPQRGSAPTRTIRMFRTRDQAEIRGTRASRSNDGVLARALNNTRVQAHVQAIRLKVVAARNDPSSELLERGAA